MVIWYWIYVDFGLFSCNSSFISAVEFNSLSQFEKVLIFMCFYGNFIMNVIEMEVLSLFILHVSDLEPISFLVW
jgi:hypothetical protein